MNNSHGHAIPHAQPVVPHYSSRRHHDMQYATQPPPQPPYPHPYQTYHHGPPQHYYHQPPPQWYPHHMHGMQPGMVRPYQQYYPVMNGPYSLPHSAPPMPPKPSPVQQMSSSSSSIRLQQAIVPTASVDRHLNPSHTYLPSKASPEPAPPPPLTPPSRRVPFYPPLPWYSVGSANDFPPRAPRSRRRRPPPQSSSLPVEFPAREERPDISPSNEETSTTTTQSASTEIMSTPLLAPAPIQSPSATPTTSQAPSEADSTHPTTPSSAVPPPPPARIVTNSKSRPATRQPGKPMPVVPVIPNIPALSRSTKRQSISGISDNTKLGEAVVLTEQPTPVSLEPQGIENENASSESSQTSKGPSPETRAPPKSWADLVRRTTLPNASKPLDEHSQSQSSVVSSLKTGTLADALTSFSVASSDADSKVPFLQPRGLINTGNMCYMNAVLQVLVYCVPFYKFLDQVGKKAAHSFKSDTPMVDAMIMFIHEFPVIDSAVSAEQLRMRLKAEELEKYGDAFTPEFVYEVIRRLPRFSSMTRGHQQDAEEFLGFLLEEMHEECTRIMKSSSHLSSAGDGITSPLGESANAEENGWLEVGPKQKAAITRSSGTISLESPITKIFGGKLRSELRVPGAKNSVTLEPFQPLQLDIGSPQVNNIIDALKGLTRSETLHGDFSSPRGPGTAATKQVFVESIPPVLILHLKRFQYDNTGGTQKIWKKVGYPLELEIPKEVFPLHKRGAFAAHGGLPRYRLTGVVYHHGKNASGGHYTVDVRRQDGREWIRLDDTVIRRVRSEDVAEGGSQEDPKVLAAALEQHKRDHSTSKTNIYDAVQENREELKASEKGWSQVNGGASNSVSAGKSWSGVANGTVTPTSAGRNTPNGRFSVKDNKVAYILFYQRT